MEHTVRRFTFLEGLQLFSVQISFSLYRLFVQSIIQLKIPKPNLNHLAQQCCCLVARSLLFSLALLLVTDLNLILYFGFLRFLSAGLWLTHVQHNTQCKVIDNVPYGYRPGGYFCRPKIWCLIVDWATECSPRRREENQTNSPCSSSSLHWWERWHQSMAEVQKTYMRREYCQILWTLNMPPLWLV